MLRYVTLRYFKLRYVKLRYVTLRYVTLRYMTLRYVTMRYVRLRSICYVTLCLRKLQVNAVCREDGASVMAWCPGSKRCREPSPRKAFAMWRQRPEQLELTNVYVAENWYAAQNATAAWWKVLSNCIPPPEASTAVWWRVPCVTSYLSPATSRGKNKNELSDHSNRKYSGPYKISEWKSDGAHNCSERTFVEQQYCCIFKWS